MSSNEGKACDAVLRILEKRAAALRHHLVFPSEPTYPSNEQVELICELGPQKFALEHTYSEPFEGFRDLRYQVTDFKKGLLYHFQGKLDPLASFELSIPINELRGQGQRSLARLRACVAEWVIATAPTLIHDPDDRARAVIREATSDVPFKLYLRRRDLLHFSPRFMITSVVPPDAERLRQECLMKSYWRKASKLLAVKKTFGAKTVLILEEDDIQGTNQHLVGDAARHVEAGRPTERPDELYLLSTCIDTWYLYPLRLGEEWLYDQDGAGENHFELNPRQLVDLTGR